MNQTKALIEGSKVYWKITKYNPDLVTKLEESIETGILIKIFRKQGEWTGLVETDKKDIQLEEIALPLLKRSASDFSETNKNIKYN